MAESGKFKFRQKQWVRVIAGKSHIGDIGIIKVRKLERTQGPNPVRAPIYLIDFHEKPSPMKFWEDQIELYRGEGK